MDKVAWRTALTDFAVIGGLLVLAVGIAMFSLGDTGPRVVSHFLIDLSAVVAIVIFMGFSGVMTFGHVGFMGVGAYIGAYLTLPMAIKAHLLPGLPDWLLSLSMSTGLALPVVVVCVGILAALVGISVCRLPSDTAPIATIGVLVIIHGGIIGAKDVTRGIQPLFGFSRLDGIWLPLGYALVTIAVAMIFRASSVGLRLQASRDNELSAAASGVNVVMLRYISWTVSAALIGGSGILLAHYLTVISPRLFYFHYMFALLAMAIIGGVSTVTGAVAGAILVTVLSETTRHIEGSPFLADIGFPPLYGLGQIALAGAILFVMYRRPNGMIAWRESTRWLTSLGGLRKASASPAPTQVTEPEPMPVPDAGTPFLRIAGISKSFAGVKALVDVTFDLNRGEILGLIGPNGSGKTTLVNVITGVLTPDRGSVHLGDADITGLATHHVAVRGIARTFQNIRVFESLSVSDNVRVAALSQKGDTRVRVASLVHDLGLDEVADTPAGDLSYGMRRRVEIARALGQQPSVLLLDEPTAGMNESETADLARTVKRLQQRYGLSLIVIEHDQNFVRSLSDRIVVLNQGRLIASGAPDDVRRDPNVVEAYLGHRAAEQKQHED